jgi:hypothetical protein
LRYGKQPKTLHLFRLLLFEVLHGGKIFKNEGFRKKSSFFSNPVGLKVVLTLSPTYLQFNIGHIIEDYRLEEWVTGEVSSVGSSPRPLD